MTNTLGTKINIDGNWYGTITDRRLPGETDEEFIARNVAHALRWAHTNYPEGQITALETVFV